MAPVLQTCRQLASHKDARWAVGALGWLTWPPGTPQPGDTYSPWDGTGDLMGNLSLQLPWQRGGRAPLWDRRRAPLFSSLKVKATPGT